MSKKTAFAIIIVSLSLAFVASWHLFKEKEDILSLKANTSSPALPNSLLDQGVFKRKKEIKKCVNTASKGSLYLEMSVLPSGSNKISLLNSDLSNSGMIECIFSILEKIKFPSFSGPKIIRFYTLQFQPQEKETL